MRGVIYAIHKPARRLVLETEGGEFSLVTLSRFGTLEVGDQVEITCDHLFPDRPVLLNISRGRRFSIVEAEHCLRADHVGLYLFSEPHKADFRVRNQT
jgi:hypothetical protein